MDDDTFDHCFAFVFFLIPITFLLCSIIYDGIVDWSYAYAFIPMCIYFIYAFIYDVFSSSFFLFGSYIAVWSPRSASKSKIRYSS